METVAQLVLYNAKQIVPGDEGFAQLRLPEAALLLPGDRFIMRQFSPVTTIGGGIVLDAAPIPRAAARDTFLQTVAGGDPTLILRARIARRQHEGISLSRLIAETCWNRNVIEAKLSPAVRDQQVLRIGDRFAETRAIEDLKLHLQHTLEQFHKKNPLVGGIGREQLREQLKASAEVFAAVAAALVGEKKLEIAGDLVRLAGRGVAMKDEEAESKKIIEDAFAAAGLKVPALREVMAGLKVDKARAQKIVTLLLRDKTLIKISEELVFHRGALEELRRQMAAYRANSSKIDVAQFKEMTGVSRKYAIPLLEYLDRERVTKRVGDAREIL
jgi:selenocysteine-specific elongation factor